jgi:hypothetical protein
MLFAGLAVIAIPVAIAMAAAPTATTNSATGISTSGATLNGSVNPGSEATTYRFDYGTSTSYTKGPTALSPAGSGSSAVPVSAPVSGLAAGTTYHYRVVAINGSALGGVNGSDHTFVTGTTPGVSTSSATNVGRSTATLRATVDPNGLATTYKFQYGTSSSSLNKSTATNSAGAGNSSINVAANIGGLASNKRIYFRITASNSAGSKNGSTRSFVTHKALTINELKFPRSRYGGSSKITGDLDGSGVSNQTVVLQGTRWPYTTGLVNLASARTNSQGNFAITLRGITANMKVRIVAAGNVTSVHNLFNGNRVGVKLRKRHRLKFSGVVTPVAPNGLVRIQKRKSNGKWHNVRRGKLKPYTNGRSRYSLSAHRSTGVYRVQVVPKDGGAHAAGYSRKVRVR